MIAGTVVVALRRRRRPPKELVFLACRYAIAVGWVGVFVIAVLGNNRTVPELVFFSVMGVIWIRTSVDARRKLARGIDEDAAGRTGRELPSWYWRSVWAWAAVNLGAIIALAVSFLHEG